MDGFDISTRNISVLNLMATSSRVGVMRSSPFPFPANPALDDTLEMAIFPNDIAHDDTLFGRRICGTPDTKC